MRDNGKFEIHLDMQDVNGAGYKIGPFRVERRDYGLVVVEGKRGGRKIFYQELLAVYAYGELFAAMAVVERSIAEGHKGGQAAARFNEAMKVLEKLRQKVIKASEQKARA